MENIISLLEPDSEFMESMKELPELKRGLLFASIASMLLLKFEQSGSMDDLEHAIATNEQATALIPNDHRNYPAILTNLSCALELRFEQIGSADDFRRSIELKEQAVEAASNDHPDRVHFLNNL